MARAADNFLGGQSEKNADQRRWPWFIWSVLLGLVNCLPGAFWMSAPVCHGRDLVEWCQARWSIPLDCLVSAIVRSAGLWYLPQSSASHGSFLSLVAGHLQDVEINDGRLLGSESWLE